MEKFGGERRGGLAETHWRVYGRKGGGFITQAWVGEKGKRSDGEKLLTAYKNRHRALPENRRLAMTERLIQEGGKKNTEIT